VHAEDLLQLGVVECVWYVVQLSKFAGLCEDGVWGVRNACAECFVQVSRVCSMHVRRTDLTQLFVDLLCDQSRWVSHFLCFV